MYLFITWRAQQLHVSALVNGHLQVVYENSFVGSYTKHICGLLIWGWEGGKVGTRSRVWSEN
jgi:hypothetical protein